MDTESPQDFLARLKDGGLPRVHGTAVFLTRAISPISPLMILHVTQIGALQEAVVSLTVQFEEVPRVRLSRRVKVEPIADRFRHVTVYYGFVEIPNLPAALACAKDHGCDIDLDDAIWFGARDEVVRSKAARLLIPWRRRLFGFLYRNAVRAADGFDLPADKFIEIGRQVEL